MVSVRVECPQCKEQVQTLAPCPACGYRTKRGVPEPIAAVAQWSRRMLVVLAVATLGTSVIFYGLTSDVSTAGTMRAVKEAGALTMPGVYLVALLWFLATLLFLCWQHSLRVNYDRLGVNGMARTPKRGVISWFIPILHLFVPYLVLQELWRAGASEQTRRVAWRQSPGSRLVRMYWLVYIITFVSALAALLFLSTTLSWGITDHMILKGWYPNPFSKGWHPWPDRDFEAMKFLTALGIHQVGHLATRLMEASIVEQFTQRQEELRKRCAVALPQEDQEGGQAGQPV